MPRGTWHVPIPEVRLDTLRNLFGNFTATIFRLVVVIGAIAAVGYFIVRPALDTTEEISNRAFDQVEIRQNDIQQQIQNSIRDTNKQIQRSLERSLNQTKQPGGGNPQALLRCIRRAQGNVDRMRACSRKF